MIFAWHALQKIIRDELIVFKRRFVDLEIAVKRTKNFQTSRSESNDFKRLSVSKGDAEGVSDQGLAKGSRNGRIAEVQADQGLNESRFFLDAEIGVLSRLA
jgi:hypothetical protein